MTMNALRFQLHYNQSYLSNLSIHFPPIVSVNAKFKPVIHPSSASPNSNHHPVCSNSRSNPRSTDRPVLQLQIKYLKSEAFSSRELLLVNCSRMAMFGAASLGFALLLMGFDEHKALALGPEGPLMEEFWDNMRRYALYALTVSTGAIYTLLQPIAELLKNPISAIVILVIFGGGIYIVAQVVTAMVGLSDFSYDYSN